MGKVFHPDTDANGNYSGYVGCTEYPEQPETNNLRAVGVWGKELDPTNPKFLQARSHGYPPYDAYQQPTSGHTDYINGGISPPPGFNYKASVETYPDLYEKYNVKPGNALCEW